MLIPVAHGQRELPLVSLEARALDEDSKPISGAVISAGGGITTAKPHENWAEGVSDELGYCRLQFRALRVDYIFSKKNDRFYKSDTGHDNWENIQKSSLRFEPFIYREDIPRIDQHNLPMIKEVSLKGSITLRRIIHPIPLYVRNLCVDIPEKNVWLGFDLEQSDWVAPHGQGKRADIRFRSNPKKEDPSQPSGLAPGLATLEMDFGDGGGAVLVTEKNGYLPVSDMKMPHQAQQDGYGKSSVLKLEQEGFERPDYSVFSGYFFRVRVAKAGDRIASANYGKIVGNIGYRPVEAINRSSIKEVNGKAYFGEVEFRYYFNPTPNDRNLEFDTRHNLMKRPETEGDIEEP
jgi:hypothetical protein